jgi:hypothetical protein
VETLDFLTEARPAAPVLAGGIGPESDLKRRLTMIMRGTTLRSLTWFGCLGALVLGGVLLPLLPTWSQEATPAAVDPSQNPPKEVQDALRAKILELQAVLEKQRHEAAETEKKLADLAAKMRLRDVVRVRALWALEPQPNPTPGGKAPAREIVLREVDGRWIIVSGPGQPAPGMPMMTPGAPNPNFPKGQPVPMTPGGLPMLPGMAPRATEGDPRIDQMEKKLQDLEKLIRELKKHKDAEERK